MCWFLFNKLEESYIDLVRDTLEVVFDKMNEREGKAREEPKCLFYNKDQFRNLV